MRYIIAYTDRASAGKPTYMTTCTAEIAESHDQAMEQFEAKHLDMIALSSDRVDDVHEAFERYGMGAWTDEEREAQRRKLSESINAITAISRSRKRR